MIHIYVKDGKVERVTDGEAPQITEYSDGEGGSYEVIYSSSDIEADKAAEEEVVGVKLDEQEQTPVGFQEGGDGQPPAAG